MKIYSFTQTVMVCVWLLLWSVTHSKSSQRICTTKLRIPRDFHTLETESLGGNGNINNRSLSAWSWTPHTSSHRIPGVIFEAECRTQFCSDPNNQQQTELNSVPIYHDTLVLQQDEHDHSCFTASFQRVAVGCTCVWAKSS
ncbi:interleukin 17a/f2 [Hoplias malabaricus]|uniref:interleukin 17a/f2 n=1 Tax=Hoplias malabaricus TaxID=27720 RepID=UPI003462B679